MQLVAGQEEGAKKQINAYKEEEHCCEATTDNKKKVVAASSSVEQYDNYWMPCRPFADGYVSDRKAKV